MEYEEVVEVFRPVGQKELACPVCGYRDLAEPPRSVEGGGSYEICPSCGFQFGVSDDDRGISYDDWRQIWVSGGMVWASQKPAPPLWNPKSQLEDLVRTAR